MSKINVKYQLLFLILAFSFQPFQSQGQKVNRFLTAMICTYNGNDYLVVQQSIFEPQARTYEQGNTRTSGYNTSRLQVYHLVDGQLIAENKLGRISDEEHTQILGYSDGIIWAFTRAENKGFIAYILTDLDTKNYYGLFMTNRDWKNSFYRPAIKELNNFFAFDAEQNRLILTDTFKTQYSFDPIKYEIAKTIYKPDQHFRMKDWLTLKGNLGIEKVNIINGNSNVVEIGGKEPFNISRYKESALIQLGKTDEKKHFINERTSHLNMMIKQSEVQLDSLLSIKNVSKMQVSNLVNLKKSIEEEKAFWQSTLDQLNKNNDTLDLLLTTPNNLFFMLSNSPEPRDGNVMISALYVNGNKIKAKWQTIIDGAPFITYRSKAGSQMQKIILDNEPDFDFTYFAISNNLFIGFYALNIFAIDLDTGLLVWRVRN